MTIFDWREYFTLAKNLSKKKDEASLRSSVSRAYYAVFCTARSYALTKGHKIKKSAGAHQEVERLYSGQLLIPTVGANLGRLRKSRNLCDYDDEVSNLQYIVELSLRRAAYVLRLIP